MRRSTIATIVAVLALAATVACREAEPPDAVPRTDAAFGEAVLSIQSQFQGPATVFVRRGESGPAQRLGTLTYGGAERYRLAPELLASAGGLRLEARAIGSGESVITEPLHVEAGDTVWWTLLDPLEQSIASVRVELSRRE